MDVGWVVSSDGKVIGRVTYLEWGKGEGESDWTCDIPSLLPTHTRRWVVLCILYGHSSENNKFAHIPVTSFNVLQMMRIKTPLVVFS